MVKLIRKILFQARLRRAVRLADTMTAITKRRHLVLLHRGRPKVFEQRQLKNAIKRKGFMPGFDIRIARKIALYVTCPAKFKNPSIQAFNDPKASISSKINSNPKT